MSRYSLRFRQVHLDFHTSGLIPAVGARFDKKQFQECLQEAKINSITCFAKCHHGWSYHKTKVGKKHPHLTRELLQEQIDACREIGVRIPIYLSAGWDELAAAAHPEWIVKNRAGNQGDPLKPHWRNLRWNSPYLDYLCRQIEEVADRWRDADGIFLDIINPRPDYSDASLREMKEKGFNPDREEEVNAWADEVLLDYFEKTNAACRTYRSDMPIFHNAGHISVGAHRYLNFNSHLELESLPTGGWGYDHFPLSARYAITTKFDFLGMTGKFHSTWGEFGGFKRPAALRYECDAMIAYGAKCSIGDQLHPSGEMNRDTYRLIGEAFQDVAAKEAWCDDVQPVAQIALISSAKHQGSAPGSHAKNYADEGASRMLLEAHLPFLVLDQFSDWEGFELVILPDSIELHGSSLAKAEAYLESGGKILASGSSLLNQSRDGFALDAGLKFVGRSEVNPDYLVATGLCPDVNVRSQIVIHGGAWNVELAGAEILAARADSYFNRTWEHFCSHQHTADSGPSAYPAVTATRNVAYFSHDIFTRYRLYGQPLYRDFVVSAIRRLLEGKLPVETNLPSTGRVNILHQPGDRRYVLHLLHATPSLRGASEGESAHLAEVIEDLVPLFNVQCTLQLREVVTAARLVPENVPLEWSAESSRVQFTVPKVEGHQMVELAY